MRPQYCRILQDPGSVRRAHPMHAARSTDACSTPSHMRGRTARCEPRGSERTGSERLPCSRAFTAGVLRGGACAREAVPAHRRMGARPAPPLCRRSSRWTSGSTSEGIDKRCRSGWIGRAREGRGRGPRRRWTRRRWSRRRPPRRTRRQLARWRRTRRKVCRETTAVAAEAATQDPQPAAQGTGEGQLVSGGRGPTRR